MSFSQEVRDAGLQLDAGTDATLAELLNGAIGRFLGWPYRAVSGSAADRDGAKTEAFASVVYAAPDGGAEPDPGLIPADTVAAVIAACESHDRESFRAAYARITQAKRLKKAPGPQLKGTPSTTVTLGIIFALRSEVPLEALAEELELLNAQTPSQEWPDMAVIASTGVINYVVQFPGESLGGDYLPPAEGAITNNTPPMYVVMVVRPTAAYTFNKMTAFLFAHLGFFSPGAKLPNWLEILDGTPQTALIVSGYQYNLKGELLPVPRQFYSDRYLPPTPYRIESQEGEILSTIQFLPWQDGGAVLLKGKLPLEPLLVFLGKKAFEKGGVIRPSPDVQISNVVPITRADFNQMLKRIQRQSNMVVKSGEGSFVMQKFADEGSSSPFIARQLIGILRLRDVVYTDPEARNKFDKRYELVNSSLMNARASAKDITKLWEGHARKVASGEVARAKGRSIQVDESIDKDLRKEVESFLNAAVRALKQGMQELGNELQVNIGFMFKKQGTFEKGIEALRSTDTLLAEYLRQTRTWSERLVDVRNAVEHEGWAMPRVDYRPAGNGISAVEPEISGQAVTEFVKFMLGRLCCFVEEFTAHGLQHRMPAEITITEIPLADRLTQMPLRFMLTPATGGLKRWSIAYHASAFEET